jgi:alkylhydroperoxidase family enzyme
MPFFKSHPADAGPANVFSAWPEVYVSWAKMSEAMMNGPSPLSPAERELLLAYAAGVVGCRFVCIAHSEVAYARGIERGLVERLVEDPETPVEPRHEPGLGPRLEPRLGPILAFVRKLALTPGEMRQADADAVFAAGWSEEALQHAIAVTARAAFMQRLVEGHGFVPMARDVAADRARERLARGYVNLYPAFREQP